MQNIRLLALFACVTLASSKSLKKQAKCVIDGGEAASDLMDAAIFIWGAKQRCGVDGMQVKCQIDVASATESVMSMTNTILKIVGRCGHHFDPDLGRAITRLIKAIAGLTAANGGIKQKCATAWKTPALDGMTLPGKKWVHGGNALCVLDVKDSAKNLLKAIKYLVKIDKKCKHPDSHACAKNSMKAVGALLGLGEWLTAAVGDCHAPSQMAHDAECSQEAIMLVHHLVKVAEASTEIHWLTNKCKKDSDCGAGHRCDDHKCIAWPPVCKKDKDCPTGYNCGNAGLCVLTPPACEVDTDCSSGLVCSSGTCVPACQVDSDCEGGTVCKNGLGSSCGAGFVGCQCVPVTVCTVDANCAAPLVCSQGTCEPICEATSDCPKGLECKNNRCGAFIDQEAFGPWAPDAMIDGWTQEGSAESNRNIPRLYEDNFGESTTTPNYTNLILGAFLPLTAFAGFVGGKFYSRRQGTSTRVIATGSLE
jgi:hypothetical protein